MSVDFAVFDPAFAPHEASAFRDWFGRQMDMDINASDPAAAVLTPPLLAWYQEMSMHFADMWRADAEGEAAIHYTFTPHVVYCSMRPQRSNDAWALATELARKLGIGSYDMMSDDGRHHSCIVFPEGPLADEPSFFSRLFSKFKG